jgi:hypothetical protein
MRTQATTASVGTIDEDTIDGNRLTSRDRAILRAVAAGHAELLFGAEPDLIIDGRCCCDQAAAHRLAHAGLIAPLSPAIVGERVPAGLTPAGTARLSA